MVSGSDFPLNQSIETNIAKLTCQTSYPQINRINIQCQLSNMMGTGINTARKNWIISHDQFREKQLIMLVKKNNNPP